MAVAPARAVAVLLLLALTGCATPVNAWQSSLERYVAEQGHGDLNVLRRTDRPPSESDFGLIGAANAGFPFIAPRRTDANGVLLGHRIIDGRSWFVYLVGMVEYRGWFVNWPLDQPRVTDIRLIAFSERDGGFTWKTGEPDAAALQQYCRPQVERWQRSDPSRAEATEAPTVFPTDADTLQLTVDGTALAVRDRHSEAQWGIDVGEEAVSDQKKLSVASDQSSAGELTTDH